MKPFYRWSILILLITAAIGCYAIGFIAGAGLFIVIGLVFEFLFWAGIFSATKKRQNK